MGRKTMSESSHHDRLNRIGHRNVIGEDLKAIQQTYDLTMLDASYLLGCHSSRYFELTSSKNAGERIGPVTRCLFIRLIYDWSAWGINFPTDQRWHHWPLMIQERPEPTDFEALIREHSLTIQKRWPTFTIAHMGVLLGLSGYRTVERWTRRGDTPNPISQRLMMHIMADTAARGKKAIGDHLDRVEIEASVRGHYDIQEVLKSSRWNSFKHMDEDD